MPTTLEPTFHYGDRWSKAPRNEVFHGSADSLLWRLPRQSVDIFWFSPPYNLADKFRAGNHDPETHEKLQYGVGYSAKGDGTKLPELVYQAQQQLVLSLCKEALKQSGFVFYSHKVRLKDGEAINPRTWIDRTGLHVVQEVIWNRGNTAQGDPRRLYPVYETIYILAKQPIIKMLDNESLRMNNPGKQSGGEGYTDVWYLPPKTVGQDRKVTGHPAVTPDELVRRCLLLANKPAGSLVCDPYCGTGTTGSVAHSLHLMYLLCDADTEWATYSERRLHELCFMQQTGNHDHAD